MLHWILFYLKCIFCHWLVFHQGFQMLCLVLVQLQVQLLPVIWMWTRWSFKYIHVHLNNNELVLVDERSLFSYYNMLGTVWTINPLCHQLPSGIYFRTPRWPIESYTMFDSTLKIKSIDIKWNWPTSRV